MLSPSRSSCQEHWALRDQTQDGGGCRSGRWQSCSGMGSEQGGAEGEREQLRGLIILGPPLAEPTGQSAARGPDEPGAGVDPSTDKGGWTRGD